MIIEFILSTSLSIDNHSISIINNYNKYNISQITKVEPINNYQYTTKDINISPYDYITKENQQLLNKEIIKSLDDSNMLLQDEEDKK